MKGLRRWLRLRPEHSLSFYVLDFLFRRVLRQNAGMPYPVHHTSTVRSPEHLRVGRETFPGDSPATYISADNGIEIGDFTNFGSGVGLISVNHDPVRNEDPVPAPPIRIGRFCWLGMNAIVLPGVQLGDFTVVGAGAVVTKSFPDGYCVIAGNPARFIKPLDRAACDAYAAERYRAPLR